MNNWKREELMEGKLCEEGLMEEHWDEEEKDLVRHLTPEGRAAAEELLKDPEYREWYKQLAKKYFSQFPPEVQRILWKDTLNTLNKIKEGY